ncbi:kinase-like domain-containing protein [Schizophyllum amplum]|uniref:non-specific serine/threonine protein kinase n=1 Tax=Schizophyllum amplum TaxID=97359 RepID=A0A550C5Q2_9AGAR|nr:kinase-like domain-containing protein [Auriculariopsis ampla]
MATAVFSGHSSNPLDVGSDPRNRPFIRKLEKLADDFSDDPSTNCRASSRSKGDDPEDEEMIDYDDDDESELLGDEGEEHRTADIAAEIEDLMRNMPSLAADYTLVDRLGTGTFSSVYKALDLHYHDKWDNGAWHGHHPPASSAHYQSAPRPGRMYVAIKRIYVTSGPERIRNEIAIMEECRGCRHVSQLITAFRHQDQVVAIMPYHRNEDFRPANFLFDPRTGMGTLCDFGLACRMEGPSSVYGQCFHTRATPEHPHGRALNRSQMNMDIESYKRMQRDAKQKSAMPSEKVGYPAHDTRPPSKANRAGTRGFRAPEVLLKCGDQTGAIDVWSVGTILLFFLTGKFPIFQSSDDTEALMEIATIVGKQKMERVAALHSRTFATNVPSVTPEGMSWANFVELNNPQYREPREPDRRYYPYYRSPLEYCRPEQEAENNAPRSSSSSPPPRSSSHTTSDDDADDDMGADAPETDMPYVEKSSYDEDIDNALDLLDQMLKPLSTERITPAQALDHPFLRDPDEPSDSQFAPHRYGEGVCGKWHWRDPVTEECIASVESRHLAAGEGVAIGDFPCEFHAAEFGFVDRD